MNVIMYDISSDTLRKVRSETVIRELYELGIRVPTIDNVKKYIRRHSDDISLFFKKNISDGIRKIIYQLSTIDNEIPLYDIYMGNLYLVKRTAIYNKVMNEHYRFPTQKLLDMLQEQKKELEKNIEKLNVIGEDKDIAKDREMFRKFHYKKMMMITIRKIDLCTNFMKSFDLDVLLNTYINALYTYSNELGKNLTLCKRPSFSYNFKHIKPYYSRSEIRNIALNMGIIGDDSVYYDSNKIRNLCKLIRENDITANVLLEHQQYIIKNKKIGLVQYYSLQGSYFMNQYLRGQVDYNCKNEYLETLIKSMWSLILESPEFNKRYIVYRFVQTDFFISQLEIGEEYTEKGFMSTTRDPFYQSDEYKFGWILLKIILPANIKGCALCIEPVSYFPNEEEIILPPNTTFKLLRKDDKGIYYHTDKSVSKKVRTTYELAVIKPGEIKFIDRPSCQKSNKIVDFLKIDKVGSLTIEEKISYFISMYVDALGYFDIQIGNHKYTVKSEWYDSSTVYKNYYEASTKNGYSMYSIHNDHILFFLELGEKYGVPYMYVNYSIKYSTLELENIIDSKEFIIFVASVAYYFEIPTVIMYADYMSCDYTNEMVSIGDLSIPNVTFGGSYCVDFYKYLKYGEKKYSNINILDIELIPKFRYHQLDILKNIIPDSILHRINERKTDDRLYQIYKKTYKDYIPEINDNLANFYIFIVENHCFLLNELIEKIANLPQYASDNPFKNDYYSFNAIAFLYNRRLIGSIPSSLSISSEKNTFFKSKSGLINRYRIYEDNVRR